MVINILEPITTHLAANVIGQLATSKSKEIDVNIMSRGGDMVAGNAIITALSLSPAKITTKVYGIAASMAAAISQAGDSRLIADDAIFQIHYGAGIPTNRPTKENLLKTAKELDVLDSIMQKSFTKSNLNATQLDTLLSEDKPLTANEAIKMEFFDGRIEPIQAEAYLNNIKMEAENSLLSKLTAFKDSLLHNAEEHMEEAPEETTTEVVTEGDPEVVPEITETVSRAEFDKLLSLVEELMKKMSPIDAPSLTEQVAAEVNTVLSAIVSTSTAPINSGSQLEANQNETEKVGFLAARQKEIQSKFKK